MPKGFVYILECNDGSYYTGSTIDIEKRIAEHNNGKGANHTKKRLPVVLVYLEEFQRIDDAFYREKQIQGWSRLKKEALIKNQSEKLPNLSMAYRDKKESSGFEDLSHQKRKSHSSVPEALEGTLFFRSNGKLLLTGEYIVLDGAMALAVPTKFGQSLTVKENDTNTIVWKSYDEKGEIWFEEIFIVKNEKILKQHFDKLSVSILNDNKTADRLIQILKAAKDLNPNFLNTNKGYTISTYLDFNRKWGLGTSSTLINNISNWANVDAYQLLAHTFSGSGYDIACAQHNSAITYQLGNSKLPNVTPVAFNPSFKDKLYFVYLNQKQNSRDGIKAYKALNKVDTTIVSKINEITTALLKTSCLNTFENLMNSHESLISNLIQQESIKSRLFNDFKGAIKSLGAWGGDFVLVTSETDPTHYFKSKGFDTIIRYEDMVF